MKGKLPGLIALLILNLILGVLMGQVFFGLFVKTVPAAVLTSFNKGTAHAAFLVYGLVAGVVLTAWSVLAIWGSRFFRNPKP